jgi:multiple sugar transport system substrate-binding protein
MCDTSSQLDKKEGVAMKKRTSILWVILALTSISGLIAAGPLHASVEIKIAAFSGTPADALVVMAKKFEKETGIKVQVSPFTYRALFEKEVSIATAKSPAFDIFFMDNHWLPYMIMNGYIVALDEEFSYVRDPDIPPNIQDDSSWPPPRGPVPPGQKGKEQHIYGLPIAANSIVCPVRKDILAEHDLPVPETWSDVRVMAEKVYKPGEFWGYLHRGERGNSVVADTLPIIWSYGGQIFDEDWNCAINNKKSVQAFELLMELLEYAAPGAGNFGASEILAEFLGGRAMMTVVWPGDMAVDMEDPEKSASAGKLEWTQVPKGPVGSTTMLGIWNAGISAFSEHKWAAYSFLQWITSRKIMREYALKGGIPGRISVFEDPELSAKYPWYPVQARTFATAEWRPKTPYWPQIEDILGIYFNKIVVKDMEIEPALNKAAEEIDSLMKEKGYRQ